MKNKPIKLELLGCGQHWGRIKGAKCSKCSSGVVANNASNERKRMLAWAVAPVAALMLAITVQAETGTASWYGDELRGRPMANGKPFNPDAMTCASWNYPLGTKLQVTHGTNTVVVTVTDRGPNKRLGRIIDLSKAAFAKLENNRRGLITVRVDKLTASVNK